MFLVRFEANGTEQLAGKLAEVWCALERHAIKTPETRFIFAGSAAVAMELVFYKELDALRIRDSLSSENSAPSPQKASWPTSGLCIAGWREVTSSRVNAAYPAASSTT